MMIDLHSHTYYSDGTESPEYLVERSHAAGVKMQALTDHDTLKGMPEFMDAAAKYPDLIPVAGCELSLRDMEILALGVRKNLAVRKTFGSYKEAIEFALSMGAAPVLPHAVRTGKRGRALEKLVLELKGYGLMGIEVFHPEHDREMADECLALARKYKLLVTAGSDFHEPDEPVDSEGYGARELGYFGGGDWKHCPELDATYEFFKKRIA